MAFSAYFPTSVATGHAPEHVEKTGAVQGGSETMLLAEDHEDLRQLALETLANLGYQVVAATEGEKAANFRPIATEFDRF
jgi:hypothetical protein